jgi:hypothetical protein
MDFIFMLTHHDVTIPNALQVFEEVSGVDLKCVGCKDVGLDLEQYRELFSGFRRQGIESFLEVVSYAEGEHFRGVDLALKIGADNLIGGMPYYTRATLDYLQKKHARLRFYPYIGKITEHPCVLGGGIEEIVKDGKVAEKYGVDGMNLLLYRYQGNQRNLLNATKQLKAPIIVAGNVSRFDQIKELKENGIRAFTIGGAVFEKKFAENGTTKEQLQAILRSL